MPFQAIGTLLLLLVAIYIVYRLFQWGRKTDLRDEVDEAILEQEAEELAQNRAYNKLKKKKK